MVSVGCITKVAPKGNDRLNIECRACATLLFLLSLRSSRCPQEFVAPTKVSSPPSRRFCSWIIIVPFNFSWLVDGHLAGMGRPGCGLEFSGEMLPHEQKFLSWLNTSKSLGVPRATLAERLGVTAPSELAVEQRMLEMYRKFRDTWGILKAYREGFGDGGAAVDRFIRNDEAVLSDLAFLSDQGIRHLVTLTERPLDGGWLEEAGVEAIHIPVVDTMAPEQDQIRTFVSYVDERLGLGEPVLAHCLGGFGRTGTMLASYLVHCGATAEQAIEEVRQKRPGSIETTVQSEAVQAYKGQGS